MSSYKGRFIGFHSSIIHQKYKENVSFFRYAKSFRTRKKNPWKKKVDGIKSVYSLENMNYVNVDCVYMWMWHNFQERKKFYEKIYVYVCTYIKRLHTTYIPFHIIKLLGVYVRMDQYGSYTYGCCAESDQIKLKSNAV